MNRLVSLLVLLCLTSFVHAGGPGQGAAVHTLVIDPGHGGMDPGAIGPGGHHEAELALGVSLKFGEMIKEAFPDVKIIYTRTTDKFVSLADRADMANKAKADLFICIHLNSATNHEAYGTSTYVLGLHRTDDNLEIAKRENAVIDLEDNKDKKYEFDPNSPEGHIIMSMKQNAFLDQSILIASKIEDELAAMSKRKSRGVKQAGFWVLYKTAMPSLLAEIGFVSNPTEEKYLATDDGQANIASSIFKAFRLYKNEIEGRKDTPEAIAKAPVAEKKKEVLAMEAVQPEPKASPASPVKQPQPETPKQPEAKAAQPSPANPSPPIAKKEEKSWEPDTNNHTAPAPEVFREKTAAANFQPIDNVATPIVARDTQEIKIRTATPAETTSKKLVPVRTADETAPPVKEEIKPAPKPVTEPSLAKKEEPKTVSQPKEIIKPVADTIKKKTTVTAKAIEPSTSKPVIAKAKTDTIKTVSIKKAIPQTPAQIKAHQDSLKAAQVKKETIAKQEPVTAKPTPKKETPTAASTSSSQQKVIFTVQLVAAHKAPKNYDDLVGIFGLINREDIDDGVVRYMAGQYTHYKDAQKTLELAKTKGFPTAFIIAYVDDTRLDVKKTKELGLKHP